MKIKPSAAVVLAFAILPIAIAGGCATPTGPDIGQMQAAPPTASAAALYQGAFNEKTVLLDPVEGEEDGASQQNLRDALWYALEPSLQQSRIFASVVTNGAADYTLDATIVSHTEIAGSVEATSAVLMVRYKLTDTKTKAVTWRETITSHYDAALPSSAATMALLLGPGAVVPKTSAANEGAVRDNLTRLVNKLAALSLARAKRP